MSSVKMNLENDKNLRDDRTSLKPPFNLNPASLGLERVFPASARKSHQDVILEPLRDAEDYLKLELTTPKLDRIFSMLWLAGLPKLPRPLHRQQLLGRTLVITEDPNEHLVWHETRIFLKPLPEFLLDHDFWEENLCQDSNMHQAACGLLLSYVWLVCHHSDWKIARETGLIPMISWREWVKISNEILNYVGHDASQFSHVSKRYRYGELRLSRLNSIYRYTPRLMSMKHLTRGGYISVSTWQEQYFSRNFAWLAAVFAALSVLLSAFQLEIQGGVLQGDDRFQGAALGVTLLSIFMVACSIGIMLALYIFLFCWHVSTTLQYCRSVEARRDKMINEKKYLHP